MNAVKVPATVQAILAARIDRLPGEEKELLQTVGVLGREFPFGLVRRVTLKPDDDLNRMLSALQLAEFIYEQPAIGDTEYIFKHALTQEVTYNSLLIERRKLLHERAGQALEALFAGHLEDHLDELAHHYSRSDNIEKAVEYLGRAGQRAAQRSAYADAIRNLTAAIVLLQKIPDSAERVQQELLIQLALGPALIVVKGYATPEVKQAYTRARGLCSRIGNTPELFPTVQGLWAFYLLQGRCEEAQELAKEVFTLAERNKDNTLLMQQGHFGLGNTLLWLGEFTKARIYLEQAIKLYDPSRHRSSQIVSINSGVFSWAFLGHVLWYPGYPDQALKAIRTAVTHADEISQPYSVALARTFASWLHQYRVESQLCRTLAETNIALSTEQGFAFTLAQETVLRGWALAEQGEASEGIAKIREGITAYRATGAELEAPYWLSLLAGACTKADRLEEGEVAVIEALSQVNESGARFCEAELHRVNGDLILARDGRDSKTAEGCYKQALKTAREQSAKSLELRATTSLARLLVSQGRRDEARAMLAAIYHWFTEGFDTADLKDAKALLDELRA
jgi:predicted ATPase